MVIAVDVAEVTVQVPSAYTGRFTGLELAAFPESILTLVPTGYRVLPEET